MSITAFPASPASPATGGTPRLADVSAVAGRRESHDHGRRAERSDDHERAPRGRHALLGALEQALSALMTAAPAAAAAPAPAVAASKAAVASPVVAVAPTASTANSGDLKDALHRFAHELFGALRPGGEDSGVNGHRGRGHAWGRTSLSDIAGRLETLAQKLATGVAAPAPGASPLVPATPPGTDPVPMPVAPGPTAGTTPTVPVTSPTAATALPPADSPLLAAFKQLAAALNLGASTASPTPVSPAEQLANLLHRMAVALGADANGTATSPAGSLIDVRA